MLKPQWGIEREPIRVALSMVAVLGLGIVGKTVSCCMFCWLAITLQRVWAAPADDSGLAIRIILYYSNVLITKATI
jgi:hypothetical protein